MLQFHYITRNVSSAGWQVTLCDPIWYSIAVLSCPLKQERRGEGTPAGRRTDQLARRQTGVHRHRARQNKTFSVDRRRRRRQSSLVQVRQSPTLAVPVSGDHVHLVGGRREAAVDGG